MCERKSSSSLGGGVSPNTSSLPPGSWGGSGLLCSSSGRSSSPGAERRRPPGTAGKRWLQEREALGRSGRGCHRDGGNVEWSRETGTDLLPSFPTASRGLFRAPARWKKPAPRAWQRQPASEAGTAGNWRAVAAFGNLRRHGRSLSLSFHPGANRKRAARLSDGWASWPMSTADGERGGE